MKKTILTITAIGLTCLATVNAQSSKEKAQQLAAEFNKSKHKEKSKNGVDVKVDVEIEARPDVKDNAAGYAADYEIGGLGQFLRLSQNENVWKGEFYQHKSGKEVVTAKLKDIKINDGLLTGIVENNDGSSK